jgi:uncharacterized membrane protein YsdA (DUF1294 family)
MIGIWGSHAQAFLLVLMIATSAAFALPIFLVPLTWARRFGWRIPEHTDLAIYFGRCLGAFILIVELLMLRAALTGTGLVFTFQVLIAVAVLMIVVHIWGALQRIQPISETLEIGMYAGLGLLAMLFYPG